VKEKGGLTIRGRIVRPTSIKAIKIIGSIGTSAKYEVITSISNDKEIEDKLVGHAIFFLQEDKICIRY
jgi:hypothetical protein